MIFNSKEEREKVIIDNIDLVHSIAARYAEKTGIDVRELESYGYEGLILGIDGYNRYNPSPNKSSLKESLYTPIKRAIEKYLNFINSYYEAVPDSLQQHKEDLIYLEKGIVSVEYDEWTALLKKYIKTNLTEIQQTALNSYYGLNEEPAKSFHDIGKELGYSYQNASVLHKTALRKLRIMITRNLDYFREVNHDIDAEVDYAKRKRRK